MPEDRTFPERAVISGSSCSRLSCCCREPVRDGPANSRWGWARQALPACLATVQGTGQTGHIRRWAGGMGSATPRRALPPAGPQSPPRRCRRAGLGHPTAGYGRAVIPGDAPSWHALRGQRCLCPRPHWHRYLQAPRRRSHLPGASRRRACSRKAHVRFLDRAVGVVQDRDETVAQFPPRPTASGPGWCPRAPGGTHGEPHMLSRRCHLR
jgi:hypothetical protein